VSTIAASGPVHAGRSSNFALKLIAFAAVVAAAVAFVWKYVFFYYLHYNPASFAEGAANYWNMRLWLLLHISGGTIALLTGPWQFWTGFRARYATLHRWMGRVYLGGVAIGCIGAYRMAIVTTFGWAFGFALLVLATAWFTSASMALYAILRRHVQVHKEWMIRTYVITFAFVTFRVMNDYYPGARLQPENDRGVTVAWACWVLPILFTEIILQLRRMRRSVAR